MKIKLRDIEIGGDDIIVQTMCNTHTIDIEDSVKQCLEAYSAGAKIIRLTTQGIREVEALKLIKQSLINNGCNIPLVADVHFSSEVAIAAASVADKVRINPGNFAKEHDEATRQFRRFLNVCKENNTAIRIGLNHGSLGERITSLYGDTPEGMKQAAMEWIKMCIDNNFYNVVVSLKASNTIVMVEAYRLLKKAMKENKIDFPLHLGVTEAGNADTGRIKSAVGIGTLLKENIGSTIRVSLTENPINEIYAGNIIANYYTSGEAFKNAANIDLQINPYMKYSTNSYEEFIIKAACDFGPLLLDKKIDDFNISASVNGEELSLDIINEFKNNLLQATRRKFTKPEYIACPGCGRTLYNLEETFNEVKKRTAHLTGVKIAVMGCIVNGPGEMADADYGYVGEGIGKVAIYRGKNAVLHSIPQEKAIDELLKIIENDKIN
jgi:1-hydroxy-2-methyl-2-(E)-butenyl 4-diphosphate synthase